jgi:hypothetical protein
VTGELELPVGRDAATVRSGAAAARADVTRRVVELEEAQRAAAARLDAERRALEAEFARRKRELDLQMAPLKAELAKIEEVAWTIDLYLGRDEEVTLLRDGSPAPADTPITIRQLVLAADEESLLLAEQGGVDYSRMTEFIRWVAADPQHVQRVIPDAKGVVVVVPSRQHRDYGDSVHNAFAEEANRQAYWLLRNGEKLYLLVTDPQLKVGDRLLPSRDEFTRLFTDDLTGKPLVPGSDAWLRAEQRQEQVQRHYMRKMLVLQGIADRSVVWQPLPVPNLNLMSAAAQDAGYVRMMDETSMVLGDGRPRFREWQRALTGRLRPGMRVVISTRVSAWTDEEYTGDRWTRPGHRRLTPSGASYPPDGAPLMIEDRRAGGLVVRYDRTDEVPRRHVPVPGKPGHVYVGEVYMPAEQRASCVIYPGDKFVLPFDLATEEDLLYYLTSREDRRGYLDMVPVLRSALKAKQEERAAEAGFRELLAGVILARCPQADPGEIERDIPALVTWWKTGNRYARPLVGDPEQESKAVQAIARESDLRRRHAGNPADDAAAVAAARDALGDRLLAVARTRSGQYRAWSPADPEGAGPWLNEYAVTRSGGTWRAQLAGEWVTVSPRTLATMRTVHAGPRWQWWDLYPATGEILTGPEAEALTRQVLGHMAGLGLTPVAVTVRAYDDYGRPRPVRRFDGYAWASGTDLTDLGRQDLDDYLACFTGTWERERDGQLSMSIQPGRPHWRRYTCWPQAVPRPADRQYLWDMCWPWRDPGSTFFNRDTNWRLAWHDPAEVSRILALYTARERHRALAVQAEDEAANHPYADAIRAAAAAAWLREKTSEARARFTEDYGRGAGDLWEHHLGTLALDRRYRAPAWLDGMAWRLARARVSVDGKTFAELAELDAGLRTDDKAAVGEWASWVIRIPGNEKQGNPAG